MCARIILGKNCSSRLHQKVYEKLRSPRTIGVLIMSEERIYELHRELAGKLIEEAKATKNQGDIGLLVNLSQEIISIRKDIFKEIQQISSAH